MVVKRNNLLYYFLISSFFIQITVYSDNVTNSSLNLYHFLICIAFLIMFVIKNNKIPFSEYNIFVYFCVIFSVLAYVRYGFSIRFVQLVFCILSFYLGWRFVESVNLERREKIYSYVAITVLVFVILRNIIFINQLSFLYSRTTNSNGLLLLASGGKNLEATLLGFIPVLCYRNKKLYLFSTVLAAFTSIMMMSRAGMITLLLGLIFTRKNRSFRKTNLLFIIVSIFLLLSFLSVFSDQFLQSSFVNRFNLNNDIELANDNAGRLALWSSALLAISHNILGYGVGNCIKYAMQYGGFIIVENNLHNIYIQYLTEVGFISLFVFLFIIYRSVLYFKAFPTIENIIFLIYCIVGMVEFTGFEPYLWFFLGAVGYQVKIWRTYGEAA